MGFRVWGLRLNLRAQSLGVRVRVQGFELRVGGVGFGGKGLVRVEGLGFGVWGLR